jgi:hypothetical protein
VNSQVPMFIPPDIRSSGDQVHLRPRWAVIHRILWSTDAFNAK